MKKVIISILILLAIAPFANAQNNFTFEACIKRAMDQSIVVQQYNLRTQAAEANVIKGQADYLPSVTAQAWNTSVNSTLAGTYDNTIPGAVPPVSRQMWQNGQVMIQADLNLWQGRKLHHASARNKMIQQASVYEKEARQQDLLLSVASAFLEVLYQQEQFNITSAQIKITSEQAQRVAAQVEAGSLAGIEQSRIKYQQSVEQAQLIANQNAISRALLNLAQLIEIAPDSIASFTISAPTMPEVENIKFPSADSVFALALTNRPSIKQRQAMIDIMNQNIKVARADALPTVYLRSQVFTNYNTNQRQWLNMSQSLPLQNQFPDNATANLTFGIRIPLFTNLTLRTNIAQAKINKQLADYDLTLENKVLYKAVHQSWFDASTARQQFIAQQQAIELAHRNFDLISIQYNAGTANGTTFAIEKNNLAKAEADLLRAKYQAVFTSKVLELYSTNTIQF